MTATVEYLPDAGLAIPPMTDPLGRYWHQPDAGEIMIDATHAMMPAETLKALPEYSSSNPSGVYSGKMWLQWGHA